MKKQRWLVLLLVVVLVLSAGVLAACKPPVPETKEYTITFKADGNVIETKKVKEGASVTFPTVPEKEGYTGVWNPSSIPSATADVVVVAVYTEKEPPVTGEKVTLSFDTMGGDEMAAVQVEKGKKATKPNDPTKEGWTFAGWFTDKALNFEFYFEDEVLNDNLTLYAAWTLNDYVVTVPSAYQNAINYVGFDTYDADAEAQLFYKDSEGAYKALKSGEEVPYGTTVYFEVIDGAGKDANKSIVVYVNGEKLDAVKNETGAAFGISGYEVAIDALYYEVEVEGNVAITATTAYVVTFTDHDDAKLSEAVVKADGTIVMPEVPTRTGWTFKKWTYTTIVGAHEVGDEFENKELTESIVIKAVYERNKYTVSANTSVNGVSLEIGATEVEYEGYVGLRVIDTREDDEIPLLVRINGKMLTGGVMGASAPTDKDKVFDIQVKENIVITVTEEERYTGYVYSSPAYHASLSVYDVKDAALLTTHVGLAGTLADTNTISKFLAKGDTIEFYIVVAEGYSVALDSDEDFKNWKIEPAKADADIAGVNDADHYFAAVKKGGNMTNKFKVTVTLPEVARDAVYSLDIRNAFTVTENTYSVKGMNIETADYILKQGTVEDKIVDFDYKEGNYISTFLPSKVNDSRDGYYQNVVFVKLNNEKNYQVKMNGTVIFDTLTDEPNAKWTDDKGVEHKVWVVTGAGSAIIGLENALCDQNWTLVEYQEVTVKLNGEKYDTSMGTKDLRKIAVGGVWEAEISNDYLVKINGKEQKASAGANTTYKYQIRNDTTVEILQKYEIELDRPGGSENAIEGEYTQTCVYGETVNAKITPNDYEGKIMVVKATDGPRTKMLSAKENVYTFVAGKDVGATTVSHSTAATKAITVSYEYTNQYVIIVDDEKDSSKDAYGPMVLIDYLTEPTKEGYIFKGWIVQDCTDPTNKTYDTRPNDSAATKTVSSLTVTHLDKVIAVYARIKPVVKLEVDPATGTDNPYKIDMVKVDGSTIYAEGSTWLKYIDTMTTPGYALDFDKAVVLTLKATDDVDEDYEVKVYVQGEVVAPNANGEYVVTLADYEYAAEDEDLVIEVRYTLKTGSEAIVTATGLTTAQSSWTIATPAVDAANLTQTQIEELMEGVEGVYYVLASSTWPADLKFEVPHGYAQYVEYAANTGIAGTAVAIDTPEVTVTLTAEGTASGNYVRVIEFQDAEGNALVRYFFIGNKA